MPTPVLNKTVKWVSLLFFVDSLVEGKQNHRRNLNPVSYENVLMIHNRRKLPLNAGRHFGLTRPASILNYPNRAVTIFEALYRYGWQL